MSTKSRNANARERRSDNFNARRDSKPKDSRKTHAEDNSSSAMDARSSKRRRGSSQPSTRSKRDAAYTQSDVLRGVNDMSWYDQYPTLTITAGAFPYPYRPGMTIPLGGATVPISTDTGRDVTTYCDVPGALTIEWLPSLGQSTLPTDPASIAGKEMYARVRKVYSGSIDADAPDFVMYTMALDSLFSYIAWLKRVYRTLNAWTPDNRALPNIVLRAMGVSSTVADQLRIDRANFLHIINELVLQSRKFRCPAIMDIFNRHYWMNDNVYLDANSLASQVYVFKPKGFYKLNPNSTIPGDSTNTAAGLVLVTLNSILTSTATTPVTDLFNGGISLINALDEWDDSYLISGYLMRAYEDTPSFVVEELNADEMLTPLYVEEVLMQIENARAIPFQSTLTNIQVSQNPATNAVISQPMIAKPKGSLGLPSINPTISIRSDSPSVTDSVIATRLHTAVGDDLITSQLVPSMQGYPVLAGTEIVTEFRLWMTNEAAETGASIPIPSVVGFATSNTSNDAANRLQQLIHMSSFDWHPIVWVIWSESSGAGSAAEAIPVGDIHNLTVISKEQFSQLNRTCLFSEFRSFTQL